MRAGSPPSRYRAPRLHRTADLADRFLRRVAPASVDLTGVEQIEAVRDELNKLGSAIVILDNLDDHSLLKHLAPLHDASLLVTARGRGATRDGSVIALRPITDHESVELLRASTGRCDDYRELARELAGIPLVLRQAGAYMLSLGLSAAEYLARLRTERLAVLAESPDDQDPRTHTILAFLRSSLGAAERRQQGIGGARLRSHLAAVSGSGEPM